ncbi:hypothetical protein ABVT39_026049 [Epinephelus coioides]
MAPLRRPVDPTWHREASTLFPLSALARVPLPPPHSVSPGLQYTPIYLPQASAVSPSVSTILSATTAQNMASQRPEEPFSASAHICVFLLTTSAWMALPGPVRCGSGALINRNGGEDRTFDIGGGDGGSPPGLPMVSDEETVSVESSPRFRRALSREKQMSLHSSSFVLKGDATHNQAMVHWTGENSSVSSLSPSRPVLSRSTASCTTDIIPLFVTFHYPWLKPQRTSPHHGKQVIVLAGGCRCRRTLRGSHREGGTVCFLRIRVVQLDAR